MKASEEIRYYQNHKGPLITSTCGRVIEKDGLFFRDIDGSGRLDPEDDWRRTADERAGALAAKLSIEEKIGLLFVNQLSPGIFQTDPSLRDESGLLDEKVTENGANIFASERVPGTSEALLDKHIRHIILRANPQPEDLADWVNQMNMKAEEGAHFLPVVVVSNSRNENGEAVFGMNDASGIFCAYPGTLGIAAAFKGTGDETILQGFAETVRSEWDAAGIKKGYMYMADAVTDPRWQRTYGTFGEDPELICKILEHLIPGIQGSSEGVRGNGIAMTVKHFPGGGARENGFDPHYAQGQWNVYPTGGSLQRYHLPPFRKAAELNTSSIMPYYAKPSKEKSAVQKDESGVEMEMEARGFAYNQYFIQGLLRERLGFRGYVNSDSGITVRMSWGVEDLDVPERIALAVNNGVDLISGSFDTDAAYTAYLRSQENYYETHPVKPGYCAENLVLSEEALTRAAERTLYEQFALGLFENPYRDPRKAREVFSEQSHKAHAESVHRKSLVLLKNNNALPLNQKKKVYLQVFARDEKRTSVLQETFRTAAEREGFELCGLEEADNAVVLVYPSSGNYFSATKGYLELDLCEGKQVPDVDENGCPSSDVHEETTVEHISELPRIREIIHSRGGKVICAVNFTLAWIVANAEKNADALIASFDTDPRAILQLIKGEFSPAGALPLTLPRGDEVLKVNEHGVCISRNDVPGYDKDQYMPESLKDENGKAYAYRDSEGNYYSYGYGLKYDTEETE